jgi:hypothetical protein
MSKSGPTSVRSAGETTLLRTASARLLLSMEYAMRIDEGGRYSLFFPSEVRRKPPASDEREEVIFAFEGTPENVFAALVIRLARNGVFRLISTWNRLALFERHAGETCTLTLRVQSPGRGELGLGFGVEATQGTRFHFDEYVNSQLTRRAAAGSVERTRRFYCPNPACRKLVQSEQAVKRARERGRTRMACQFCSTEVSLLDRAETVGDAQSPAAAEMDRAADTRRDLDVAALTLRGKTLTDDFDAFFVNYLAYGKTVLQLDTLLKEQGLLARLVPERFGNVIDFTQAIDEAIKAGKPAVVFIGAYGLPIWQRAEVRVAVKRMTEEKLRLIAVLLSGASRKDVPRLFEELPLIDMREFTPAAMEQLLEAIAGQSGRSVDPDAGRPAVSLTQPDKPPAASKRPRPAKRKQSKKRREIFLPPDAYLNEGCLRLSPAAMT